MITRNLHTRTSETRFAPTAAAPGQARAAVKDALAGQPRDTIDTASLLVSELVTNSLRHGHALVNPSVVLRIAQNAEVIRFEVVDWGEGFEYEPRSQPLDHAGGWGLYLVEQLSFRWGIESGSPNVVWFELAATT